MLRFHCKWKKLKKPIWILKWICEEDQMACSSECFSIGPEFFFFKVRTRTKMRRRKSLQYFTYKLVVWFALWYLCTAGSLHCWRKTKGERFYWSKHHEHFFVDTGAIEEVIIIIIIIFPPLLVPLGPRFESLRGHYMDRVSVLIWLCGFSLEYFSGVFLPP